MVACAPTGNISGEATTGLGNIFIEAMRSEGAEAFVPVALSSSPTERAIRIEVRRKGRSVSIEWPASAAHECGLLLRELIR
jgi:hypothetical protein